MAHTVDFKGQAGAVSATITSNALTVSTGDFVTVIVSFSDNGDTGTTPTISNTGTAIAWTQRAATNTASNVKIVLWSGVAGATPPGTVSVVATGGGGGNTTGGKVIAVIAHTAAHAATPLPAGNIFSGTSAHNASQSITPTAPGSWLWMMAGDWAATNTFAAAVNCSLQTAAYQDTGNETVALFRPTTQPLTTAAAFTIGETDTGGTIAWIAFEVHAGDPAFPGNGGGGYDDRVRVERSTFQGNGTGAAAAMFMSRWPESARDQGYSDQRDDNRSRLN